MDKIEFFEEMLGQRYDSEIRKKHYQDFEWYCCNAYEFSQQTGASMLIFRDVCWERYPKNMTELLLPLGIRKICIICHSCSLLEWLQDFQELGWRIVGMETVSQDCLEGRTLHHGPGIVLEYGGKYGQLSQLLQENQDLPVYLTVTDAANTEHRMEIDLRTIVKAELVDEETGKAEPILYLDAGDLPCES